MNKAKQINDILIKMQNNNICIGEASNELQSLFGEEPKKYEVKIDDTTAFGVPHHDHNKHRVSVSQLNYQEALLIQKIMTNLLS